MSYYIPFLTIAGLLGLLIYIPFDFQRNKFRNMWKRAIFYSFVFYLIIVSHLTIGHFNIPPQWGQFHVQFVPFRFISDWLIASNSGSWFFWNSVKLTFYNLIMLVPLGIYLVILFNCRPKRGILFVFWTSLTIEILQLVLSYFGFLFYRVFNVDDLMLNTLGGAIGIGIARLSMKLVRAKPAGEKITT